VKKVFPFLILIFGWFSLVLGQNIQYEIEITNTDSLYSAQVTLTIPEDIQWSSDTIWIQWPFVSYTQKNSPFISRMVKSGETNYYFRRDKDRGHIKSCQVTIDGERRDFSPLELEDEFIPILRPQSRKITFSYDFLLPDWHYSMGVYKDKLISFDNFYPRLVYNDGSWRKQPFYGGIDGLHYNQDVSIKLPQLPDYKVVANGDVSINKDFVSISAKNVPHLFVTYVKQEFASIKLLLKSGDKLVKYFIVQEPLTKLPQELTKDSMQNIFNALTDVLGPYPYEHLIIYYADKGLDNGFDKGVIYMSYGESYLSSIIMKNWIIGQFQMDNTVDAWMTNGLIRYYETKLNPTEAKKRNNDKYFKSNYEEQLYNISLESKKLGQVQCLLKNYYLPQAFFEYIEEMLGESTLRLALNNIIKNDIVLNVENLTKELKNHTEASLDFIDLYIANEKPISFKIMNVNKSAHGIEVRVKSDKNLSLPIPMTVAKINDEERTIIIPSFEGEQTVRIPDIAFADIKYIVLDKNHILPDKNRKDNYWISDDNLFKKDFEQQYPRYDNSNNMIFPTVTYNDNNRFMLGFFYSNNREMNYRKTGYTLHPMFSFRKSRIQGEAAVYHDIYTKSDIIDRIRLSTEVRSYFFNYNEKWDYTQQYIRVDPEIHLRFKKALRRGADSGISLKSYLIHEEYPTFDNGKFSTLTGQNSTIIRATYYSTYTGPLASTHHDITLEQQSYNDESYLKLSASLMQNWMYKNKKYIRLRLFGSGFLTNTQRQSLSYQNTFTRGSIALIHQGFNDYTYDEYFFGRQNQNQSQRHQVSMYNGGGFKTAVGSAYNIGTSNNFAIAANGAIDLPFGPTWLPIQLYFDMGVFSTYSGDKFVNNMMYNGGFSVHLTPLLTIHIPLVYSENLGNIHRELHNNFFNRISFSFNLDRISKKRTLFENFRKW